MCPCVSVHRGEDITETLWGNRDRPSTISDLNQKIFERIDAYSNRSLVRKYLCVLVDGIWPKRAWGVEVEIVSVLVAIGVNQEGYREVLCVVEGSGEDLESWHGFLRYQKEGGLEPIRLLVSDKSLGLLDDLYEYYPDAHWQRCTVHFYRNVQRVTPRGRTGK